MRLAVVLALLAVGGLISVDLGAAPPVKSGPQIGEKVPGPFHPLNVNGDQAGKKFCLYCVNGDNPVAMVFARQPSKGLTKLIKQLDKATADNKEHSMGSFVVFLNDSEKLERDLKSLAEQESIKNTVLSIDNPAGPKNYKIAKNSEVTVVLYTGRVVKANYSFTDSDLAESDVSRIMADISKILPKS